MKDEPEMGQIKVYRKERLQKKLGANEPVVVESWLEKYRSLPRFLGSFRDYCYAMHDMGCYEECYCEVIDTSDAEMFVREKADRFPVDVARTEWLMGKGLAALVDYKQFPDGSYVGTPLKRRK